MTFKQTGFQTDSVGSWISKDPQAQLTYKLDWSLWLLPGESLSTSTYELQVRANDPQPLTKIDSQTDVINGITSVTLSGGQVGKVYTITCRVTTDQNNTDRRSFRVKVENRTV